MNEGVSAVNDTLRPSGTYSIQHDDLTEKKVSLVSLAKFIKGQKCKTALCDFKEKLVVSKFIGLPNLLEAKSMDESS